MSVDMLSLVFNTMFPSLDVPGFKSKAGKPAQVSGATVNSVLLAMANNCGEDGTNIHPSNRTLALRANCDERTIQRTLTALQAAGYVEMTRRPDGKFRTNTWRLCVERWPAMTYHTPQAERAKQAALNLTPALGSGRKLSTTVSHHPGVSPPTPGVSPPTPRCLTTLEGGETPPESGFKSLVESVSESAHASQRTGEAHPAPDDLFRALGPEPPRGPNGYLLAQPPSPDDVTLARSKWRTAMGLANPDSRPAALDGAEHAESYANTQLPDVSFDFSPTPPTDTESAGQTKERSNG